MRDSDNLKAERDFVEKELHGLTICERCKATLLTYADSCIADLSDACPGFQAIEAAKEKFKGLVQR